MTQHIAAIDNELSALLTELRRKTPVREVYFFLIIVSPQKNTLKKRKFMKLN